jgi:DeoR/GlpR family transcriptional regulator of sugar metabolism
VIAVGRRRKIVQILEEEGNVKVDALAGLFDVSQVTIRKDLTEPEGRAYFSALTEARCFRIVAGSASRFFKD